MSLTYKPYINTDFILEKANAALSALTIHITDSIAPHSPASINDFYSNADYWWPDPEKPDGLSYIRRDGESNPNNFNDHRMALRTMRTCTVYLAAAYNLTREKKYAAKAAA